MIITQNEETYGAVGFTVNLYGCSVLLSKSRPRLYGRSWTHSPECEHCIDTYFSLRYRHLAMHRDCEAVFHYFCVAVSDRSKT